MKKKKNELVCPICGGAVEHTVKSTKKYVNGVWEDIKEKHIFKCPECHTGEFKMSSVEEFREYCAWRDRLVNQFIIIVDDKYCPSLHIGVDFKDEDNYRQYHNFHPGFCLDIVCPRPEHRGKVFFPEQREEAFALYQKFVEKYLDSLKCDHADKLGDLLGTDAGEEYPEFWEEGMSLLHRFEQHKLEQSFAKFLRFLHEYDTLVKDYPREKDQIKHLSVYFAWLYQEGDSYPYNACLKGHEKGLEEKLLEEFKKTHK